MWSGIILAGGTNRRMDGAPKSLLRFGNETLVERQVREMRTVCSEIIVVTDEPGLYLRVLDRDVRIITDYYRAKGPLVGIHAGLKLSTLDRAWIVGCDMPYIDARASAVLRDALHQGGQAAVPNVNGGLYPLHGLYEKGCAELAGSLIEQGETSASALLRHLDWQEVGESRFTEAGVPLHFVTNINTVEDYERIRAGMEARDRQTPSEAS